MNLFRNLLTLGVVAGMAITAVASDTDWDTDENTSGTIDYTARAAELKAAQLALGDNMLKLNATDPTKDPSKIQYTWYKWDGSKHVEHTARLTDEATDTAQIKYLISFVARNPEIPGSVYLARKPEFTHVIGNYSYQWLDSYDYQEIKNFDLGNYYKLPWSFRLQDADFNDDYCSPWEFGYGDDYYYDEDEEEYGGTLLEGAQKYFYIDSDGNRSNGSAPEDHSLTMFLVECKPMILDLDDEDFDPFNWWDDATAHIKSMRLLTSNERYYNDQEVAEGKSPFVVTNISGELGSFFVVAKGRMKGPLSSDMYDFDNGLDPFVRYYEQLSSTINRKSVRSTTEYWELLNDKGEVVDVLHDCTNVLWFAHQLNLGKSDSYKTYEANIFMKVPDYRLEPWTEKETSNPTLDDYFAYEAYLQEDDTYSTEKSKLTDKYGRYVYKCLGYGTEGRVILLYETVSGDTHTLEAVYEDTGETIDGAGFISYGYDGSTDTHYMNFNISDREGNAIAYTQFEKGERRCQSMFTNYNPDYQPRMIQYKVTQAQPVIQSYNADSNQYTVKLSWTTNYQKLVETPSMEEEFYVMVPDSDGNFTLYLKADGTTTADPSEAWAITKAGSEASGGYFSVAYNTDGITAEEGEKTLKYVIKAHPKFTENNAAFSYSNDRELTIVLQAKLSLEVEHTSVYDNELCQNDYDNTLILAGSEEYSLPVAGLHEGATISITRHAQRNEANQGDAVTVATWTVTSLATDEATGVSTIAMTAPDGESLSFTVAGENWADYELTSHDIYSVSTRYNNHADLYLYQAEASLVYDESTTGSLQSPQVRVRIPKASIVGQLPYTLDQVMADTDMGLSTQSMVNLTVDNVELITRLSRYWVLEGKKPTREATQLANLVKNSAGTLYNVRVNDGKGVFISAENATVTSGKVTITEIDPQQGQYAVVAIDKDGNSYGTATLWYANPEVDIHAMITNTLKNSDGSATYTSKAYWSPTLDDDLADYGYRMWFAYGTGPNPNSLVMSTEANLGWYQVDHSATNVSRRSAMRDADTEDTLSVGIEDEQYTTSNEMTVASSEDSHRHVYHVRLYVTDGEGNYGVREAVAYTSISNDPTGVEAEYSDEPSAPVVYYNLQGVRVEHPSHGDVLIRVQGRQAQKILIK
ncbi:MAG: hypothetical protein LIP02_08230 [Bacteroidales bacterium]|nr:hypothetical protein [Bacteroidales bacterium]